MTAVKLLQPLPEQPDRPLLVYLPGMDGMGTLLASQLDSLAPWFDIRCVAINPDDQSVMKVLAEAVCQQLINLVPGVSDRQRRVYLCGESFGGCLAMQVLTMMPGLFDQIVLINPASSFRRLPWMQLGPMITRQIPKFVYPYSTKGLITFLINDRRVAPSERVALEKAMSAVSPETSAWRMGLLSAFKVSRLSLERMMHPVLLIGSEGDRLLPSVHEVKSLASRFPHATVKTLPESGHACLLEKSVNLGGLLKAVDFLPQQSAMGAFL